MTLWLRQNRHINNSKQQQRDAVVVGGEVNLMWMGGRMDVDWLTAVDCRQIDWLVEGANGGGWLIGWSADAAMFQKSTAVSIAVWSTDDVCLFQKSTGMTDYQLMMFK